MAGLEGCIRPAFSPLKVFLRNQHGVSYMMQKKIQFDQVRDPALIGAKFRNQYGMQNWTSDMK